MKKLLSIIFIILMLASTAFGAVDIPAPSVEFYVNDTASVLSDETIQDIITKNDYLYNETGAQIVVVTVDFINTASIADYAYELFNSYGIGDANKNNGLLLLLSIGDDDYYALQGEGLERTLTAGTLSYLLYDYLEPYFAVQDYDKGTAEVFNQFYKEMLAIHGIYDPNIPSTEYYPDKDYEYYPEEYYPGEYFPEDFIPSGFNLFYALFRLFRTIFIFIIILSVLSSLFGRRTTAKGSSGGSGFWSTLFLLNMLNRSSSNRSSSSTFNNNINRMNSSGSSFRGSSGGFSSGGGMSRGGGGGMSRGGGAGRGGR